MFLKCLSKCPVVTFQPIPFRFFPFVLLLLPPCTFSRGFIFPLIRLIPVEPISTCFHGLISCICKCYSCVVLTDKLVLYSQNTEGACGIFFYWSCNTTRGPCSFCKLLFFPHTSHHNCSFPSLHSFQSLLPLPLFPKSTPPPFTLKKKTKPPRNIPWTWPYKIQ